MTNNNSSDNGRTYLLIHGAWHGAWCWQKVVPLLQAKGHQVIAIDLPGHGHADAGNTPISLDDYVDEVIKTLKDITEPVVLVGHSMAGIVISQAAEKLGAAKVSSLIYIDAFLPKNGDSLFSLVEDTLKNMEPGSQKPALIDNIIISPDQKTNSINPDAAAHIFYHDCSEDDKRIGLSLLTSEPIAPLATPLFLSDRVYGVIPKFYILCTQSRDMNKKFLSTHVPCEKVYELESSHSPFFSMPGRLVDILHGIN